MLQDTGSSQEQSSRKLVSLGEGELQTVKGLQAILKEERLQTGYLKTITTILQVFLILVILGAIVGCWIWFLSLG